MIDLLRTFRGKYSTLYQENQPYKKSYFYSVERISSEFYKRLGPLCIFGKNIHP